MKRQRASLQCHHVRTCAIKQEKRLYGILTQQLSHHAGSLSRPGIITIGNGMIAVCHCKGFQDSGMNARVVVTSETSHILFGFGDAKIQT